MPLDPAGNFMGNPMTMPIPTATRIEHDSLGDVAVPEGALWGVHTARALENFPIARRPISVFPELVTAFACVKQAAARANKELGDIEPALADVIDQVCQEIIDGQWHDQFVVGVMQGGAGTSTNMNANEVIANRGLEILGHKHGEYQYLHPIDDVNRSQSTNDTYPTSVKVALAFALQPLLHELELLRDAFAAKAVEFQHILKVGRTQLQDAVPMTLGEDIDRLRETIWMLCEVNLGATAIGTGITANPAYAAKVVEHLSAITKLDITSAPDLIEATSDAGGFMSFSGTLKRSAIKLSKICNDLRLLSSGPQAGLGEINLPARQAGSSIMPGKVNPVIPEVVNQVAFVIAGTDVTVTMAAEGGQLQLNAFEPVIAYSLLTSITWLAQSCLTLRVNCVDGITANTEKLAGQVSTSVGVITALIPVIGYQEAADLAKVALKTGRPVADLVVEAGLMTREAVEAELAPAKLAGDA